MVKKRVKNSIAQREFRGEESISLTHSEIPAYLWSQISKFNPHVNSLATFLRGDTPDVVLFPSIGSDEYLKLRNVAISNGWLKTEPSKIITPQVPKKTVDRIRQENNLRLAKQKMDAFLQNEDIIRPTSALEFRVMGLMRYADRLAKSKNPNERELYSIALSLLKMPIDDTVMIPELRADLLLFREQFLKRINFDMIHALEFYPDLLTNPPFVDILPLKPSFSLRPNQQRILDLVVSDEPVLVINRDSLGSGKTVGTVAVAINLRQENKYKTVVFCCASSAIRLNVAQMAAATQVPFALYDKGEFSYPPYIAQTLDIGETAFVNLIIADYESTKRLLENVMGNFVLFLDEPTIGADNPNDSRIHLMIDILFNLSPAQTVIVSGTLPPYNDFREVYDRIKIKKDKPNTQVVEITGKGSSLGCDLIRKDNTYYVPENMAAVPSTPESLKILRRVLVELKDNPLLTRFHNFRRLLSIYHFLDNDDRIDEIDDIGYAFENPENWRQEAASRAVNSLLIGTSKNNPEVIPDLCQAEDVPSDRRINFKDILTKEAHRLFGGCLVVSSDPVESAEGYVEPLLKRYALMEMRRRGIPREEIEDLEAYAWDLLGREVVTPPVVQVESHIIEERIQADQDDERASSSRSFRRGKVAEGEAEVVIEWGFPKFLQINSPEHQQVYNPGKAVNRKDYVPPVIFEDLPKSSAISADLLVLLAMGIGIYDESLPRSYIDSVINLASQGKISFLFSNLDISYGVTIPLNRLIIADDEIVDIASTSTMIQLLGRIGRLGRMALIYTVGEELESKFNRVLRGHKDLTEQENILSVANKF